MVGINQKVESRRKGTSALAVQKKGEVFTVIYSSTYSPRPMAVNQWQICSLSQSISAFDLFSFSTGTFYLETQEVSNLISIF
jgi:hypothetical protein